ncbi:MAG: ATP-binding cassette domain-containing protein [Planctomycetes bacterium]|nr:ATP-binding cassette domain-containing protein [Planctomycetota bacterium]
MPESDRNLMLSLQGVSAGYFKKWVIRSVDLDVFSNDVVAVLGPNGSGKSTLIKAILGLVDSVDGKVVFKGKNITGQAHHKSVRDGVSYLLQDRNVFTCLSVRDNLRLAGFGMEEHRQFQNDVLDILPEIKSMLGRRAGLLSGGERQMLAVAMVFMRRPILAILDEPSAGLSTGLVTRVMQNIREFNRRYRMTFIISEQNIRAVLEVATRVVIMKNGGLHESPDFRTRLLQDNLKEIFFS